MPVPAIILVTPVFVKVRVPELETAFAVIPTPINVL